MRTKAYRDRLASRLPPRGGFEENGSSDICCISVYRSEGGFEDSLLVDLGYQSVNRYIGGLEENQSLVDLMI